MGFFETSEDATARWHQPVRVPIQKGNVFGAAREMCEDLEGWTVLEVDEDALTVTCECKRGVLGGSSRVVVRVEGPDGIPSSTTHVRSESTGGLLPADKKIVTEFVKKFTMRIC